MGVLMGPFLAALPEGASVQVSELETALVRLLDRAHVAWPDLQLDGGSFVAHVAGGLETGPITETTLTSLRIEDLALACACGSGDEHALSAFERRYADDLRAILARFKEGPDLVAEVQQRLRQRLFVAEAGERPGICRYTGKGELLAFVRVTAVRIALDLLRARGARKETSDDELLELPFEETPELQYLRGLYQREFKAAFEAAFAALPPRWRTLLRYEHVDRLSIDKLAALYGLHRSTMARQLNAARHALVDATRVELGRRLQLHTTQLDSVMRMIESDVELSLERVFGGG